MNTSSPRTQDLCYRQAARLMNRGASLSFALRGCLRGQASLTSATKIRAGFQTPAEDAEPQSVAAEQLVDAVGQRHWDDGVGVA